MLRTEFLAPRPTLPQSVSKERSVIKERSHKPHRLDQRRPATRRPLAVQQRLHRQPPWQTLPVATVGTRESVKRFKQEVMRTPTTRSRESLLRWFLHRFVTVAPTVQHIPNPSNGSLEAVKPRREHRLGRVLVGCPGSMLTKVRLAGTETHEEALDQGRPRLLGAGRDPLTFSEVNCARRFGWQRRRNVVSVGHRLRIWPHLAVRLPSSAGRPWGRNEVANAGKSLPVQGKTCYFPGLPCLARDLATFSLAFC